MGRGGDPEAVPTRLMLPGTEVTSGQCLGLDEGAMCYARVTWAKWGSRGAPGLLLRLSGRWTGQDWYGMSGRGPELPGQWKKLGRAGEGKGRALGGEWEGKQAAEGMAGGRG